MLESSDLELEDERVHQLELLARERDLSPGELVARYVPGTLGCHEAMHSASIVLDLLDDRLLQHPAVTSNPEWFRLASRASEALFNLYQSMGAAQIEKTAPEEGIRPEELNASNDD